MSEEARLMAEIFHVTPITRNAALTAVCTGRHLLVSMYHPDQMALVCSITGEGRGNRRADHGRFSTWIAAMKAGREWCNDDVPSAVYYRWLEEKFGIWDSCATAIMPDIPGAPSQLNDAELLDWPFPVEKGLPVYHMDAPISRLARLLERYPLVCMGWIGDPKKQPVGCPEYWARIHEIEVELGYDIWPRIHMLRGVAVAGMRPFAAADSSSLGQNGWRHDWLDTHPSYGEPLQWRGRTIYAEHLEGNDERWNCRPPKGLHAARFRGSVPRKPGRRPADQPQGALFGF